MARLEIKKNIFWVGAIDWNLRFCGSYTTPRGTTYNAYLIIDKKIALVDTVKMGFEHEMLERIKEIIDPKDIDYLICQHSELDHSGAIPEMMKVAKDAQIVCTQACKEAALSHFGKDWPTKTVKTADTISLGEKSLMFIEAKMLHWPDNMFTYVKEDKILFPNDAFGQHIATFGRFEDEVGPIVMEEATKYFAVIVSVYSNMVKEKIKEIEALGLVIEMIAPAHGLIWRQPKKIIDAYKRWSMGEAKPKVTVVFDTMWHSTEKMAQEISRGIAYEGIEVRVFNLRNSDWTEIIKEIIESRIILVGSPTLNMGMFPTVGGFLTFLKGIRPPNKKAAAFGSFGWGKGAVGAINEEFKNMKFGVLESLEIKYVPYEKELFSCFEFGKRIAKEAKN